jgi:hypothetical protein
MTGRGLAEATEVQLLATLWSRPDARLYAVLDGARDPRIQPWIAGSGQNSACLYDGQLAPPLVPVAPYLVELGRETPATRRLLVQGWGKQWGIWVEAPVALAALRRHLRRFLLVTEPKGRLLLFRYYDPRVLRVYLPACTPEELESFFGPIACIYSETRDGNGLLRFRRGPKGLEVAELPL